MNEKIEELKKSAAEFGRKAKDEACVAARKAGAFVARNKEMIAISVPVAVAAIQSGRTVLVNRRTKRERNRIDNTYYDPATGFHWELRRKATNADRAEILKRKKAGKETYDILRELNLIK